MKKIDSWLKFMNRFAAFNVYSDMIGATLLFEDARGAEILQPVTDGSSSLSGRDYLNQNRQELFELH